MKKIIALILVALMVISTFAFTSCGSVNKADVAILWSGDGEVKVPNSLINCMERAMYIENIAYAHYGANLKADDQLKQAKDALAAGCAALVVELINPLAAKDFVDAAKEKNVPVIFFNCLVADDVVDSYDKCYYVASDLTSIPEVQGKMIADYVIGNFENIDRNGDGKISYVSFADTLGPSIAEAANKVIKEDKKAGSYTLEFYDDKNFINDLTTLGAGLAYTKILESYNDDNKNMVELVITTNDLTAYEILSILQSKDFNTDKLKTHLIPIFTVGASVDYKQIVLAGKPSDESKVAEYYESMKFLCDLTAVAPEDLDEMIFNTANVIDTGRLAGTALEDQDAMAESVAKILRNLFKEKNAFDKVEIGEIKGSTLLIDYTVYPN